MSDEDRPGAQRWVPGDVDQAERGIRNLNDAAEGCRGCELWRDATQLVFSSGPAKARIMLVGEQPGDKEDREGVPFIGPAGGVLDEAFEAAGIHHDEVYLTNAVKHFRFTRAQRGKRRIHEKPAVAHIQACHPWLEAELAVVRPDVVVSLGATAGRSVLGRPGADRRKARHSFRAGWAPGDDHGAPLIRAPAAGKGRLGGSVRRPCCRSHGRGTSSEMHRLGVLRGIG
jgi:uracil-DNA glycosylase family protein